MAPKTKSAVANGAPKKAKSPAPSASPTPAAPQVQVQVQEFTPTTYGPGRPDKTVYNAEQNKIKADIDVLQAKVNAIKEKMAPAGRNGSGNDRQKELYAELDLIRGQQSNNKTSRSKVIEQLKTLQEGIQKKIKDLNASKAKYSYKTVAEADARISQLERQVESGNLKLVEEKRALQEISQIKRSRRIIENFQADQDAIEADRAQADELRKQLDDPEAKAASERYDAIKAELDELKKENQEAHANRSKLQEERNALQGQLDELYDRKRESAARYKDANDKYFAKLNEDRARRAERARAQRAEQEEAKKKELVDRLREDAEAPAFQAQIEDCQTLIDHFSGKSSTATLASQKPLTERSDVAGVPKLDIRKVETAPEGVVVRKKKGEEEEAYFVAGKGKKKGGKKGGAKPVAEASGVESSSGQLNIPFPTLSALLSLSIPPPTSMADVPRVIDDLNTKKAWFEANQARVTAENKAKAEAEIRKLLGGKSNNVEIPPSSDTPPAAELASVPALISVPSIDVSSEDVSEKPEAIQEAAVEA